MIFKAYIKELPQNDSNIFKVRVPFLEDNTKKEVLFDALLCNQPGEYSGYKIGDCVFVVFENDKLNTPVILGKLYTGITNDISSYHVVNNLNVTGTVKLPKNTALGDYSARDIFSILQQVSAEGGSGGSNFNYILYAEWEDSSDGGTV